MEEYKLSDIAEVQTGVLAKNVFSMCRAEIFPVIG